MSFQNWLGKRYTDFKSNQPAGTMTVTSKDNRRQQSDNGDAEKHQNAVSEDISIIYLASNTPIETVLVFLRSMDENEAKVSFFFNWSIIRLHFSFADFYIRRRPNRLYIKHA